MEEKLTELFPPFAESLSRLLEKCRIADLPFRLFCGYRSHAEQDRLYAQGRTAPGKIVTNARAGDSWHNYGLAADLVLWVPGPNGVASWSWSLVKDAEGRSLWVRMAEFAVAEGLDAGWFWKRFMDPPHVQKTYGLTIEQARNLHRAGGADAVWMEARKNHG